MNQEIIKTLEKHLNKALKENEVPVAACIVKDNKVIASAHNKRHNKWNVLNHAELICIKKAAKKNKDWRLADCDIYVTLEPCNMCLEIIKASRINNVYYFSNRDENAIKSVTHKCSLHNQEIEFSNICTETLKNFFKNKRN